MNCCWQRHTTAFYVTLDLCAHDGSYVQPLRVKTNTGAKYTRLPGCLLRELGWEPQSSDPIPWGWPLEMFYDVDVEARRLSPRPDMHVGEINLRVDGHDYLHSAIYGADDGEPVLGNWTVRGFVLNADEANQRLLPIELIHR